MDEVAGGGGRRGGGGPGPWLWPPTSLWRATPRPSAAPASSCWRRARHPEASCTRATARSSSTTGPREAPTVCARCHTYGWSFDATTDGDDSIDGHAGPIVAAYNNGGGFFGPNLTGGSTLDQFETAAQHSDFISAGQSIGQTYGRGGSGGNGQMPGFGPRTDDGLDVIYPATLTQDQIDAVVAFERNL